MINFDGFDLPDVVKFQLVVLFKFELPFDTGNLRHNAAGMIMMKPGAKYRIDESEADYTRKVFEYYLYKRGQNFMYNAAFAMYEALKLYFEGHRITWDEDYMIARRNVLWTSKDTEERQVKNVLHGSGSFASDSLKENILNNSSGKTLFASIADIT